ncbi:DNA circularization N-terminal domain-containing protein [Ancylobacter oerskovii]|uniref:DNA circularization N-terminal domain-containing protein n=1 Tax=Ancylobacter oerskovii TaxID=459519 RepID=A0ABW4Z375_9HYPH|nr:DNA circularization N-terminal domain-containing protein [Ancylobacter oerskovii]MBS7546251.1 DNA circularization N-terminal domain-containing protein [Ancylobacter oerskovii]
MAYLPATFRGVRFHVLEVAPARGKRVEVHEFPKRDTPYAESFGRLARRYAFRAFMLGRDAALRAEALALACEVDGAGLLTLPSAAPVLVECLGITNTESVDHGRMVMLDMAFVEKGDAPGLLGFIVTSVAAINAVVAVAAAIVDLFTAAVDDMGPEAQRIANEAVIEHCDAVSALHVLPVDPLSHAHMRLAIGDLRSNPAPVLVAAAAIPTIAEGLADTLQLPDATRAEGATTERDLAQQQREATVARASAFASAGSVLPKVSDGPEYRAVVDFIRRIWLLEYAKALASMDFASRDEADAYRADIAARFDAEIDIAATARDADLLAALRISFAATVRDLVERGRPLPALRTVKLAGTLPAVVAAHRLWQDASRAAEVATYAGAVHPGFMPREFKALSA